MPPVVVSQRANSPGIPIYAAKKSSSTSSAPTFASSSSCSSNMPESRQLRVINVASLDHDVRGLHVLDSLESVGVARLECGGEDFILLKELAVGEREGVNGLARVLFLLGEALLEFFDLGREGVDGFDLRSAHDLKLFDLGLESGDGLFVLGGELCGVGLVVFDGRFESGYGGVQGRGLLGVRVHHREKLVGFGFDSLGERRNLLLVLLVIGTLDSKVILELDDLLLEQGSVLLVEVILVSNHLVETLNLNLLLLDLVAEIGDVGLQRFDGGVGRVLQGGVLCPQINELLVEDGDLLLTVLFKLLASLRHVDQIDVVSRQVGLKILNLLAQLLDSLLRNDARLLLGVDLVVEGILAFLRLFLKRLDLLLLLLLQLEQLGAKLVCLNTGVMHGGVEVFNLLVRVIKGSLSLLTLRTLGGQIVLEFRDLCTKIDDGFALDATIKILNVLAFLQSIRLGSFASILLDSKVCLKSTDLLTVLLLHARNGLFMLGLETGDGQRD
ncbi:hypothetical protein HBI88_015110 [Parastagonospora nodorum]|nr:hypothetical protein HBH51_032320 [Parastagonospora nodorum]KAH5776117.1 hypothetical protein HBI97_131720 [Parastagonospora nodorum]KAH5831031.1 hypothetical protein HBI93_119700 [Parastagonospora nodorum]KAH5946285.1 hypothetical protein HBI88_015110 [Parastagonospora nodorum]